MNMRGLPANPGDRICLLFINQTDFMKKSTHIFMVLLLTGQFALSQSAEKTLVSSVNPNEYKSLGFDLEGEIHVIPWDGNIIKVQTLVSIQNAHEAVLKSLVSAGRYRIISVEDTGRLTLSSPGLKKKVSMSGVALQESITYQIYVPKTMQVDDTGIRTISVSALQEN